MLFDIKDQRLEIDGFEQQLAVYYRKVTRKRPWPFGIDQGYDYPVFAKHL